MARSEFSYELALLKLMNSLPNRQGLVKHILKLFEQQHRTEIPPDHFSQNASGHVRWLHRVQWIRQRFINLGLMDSPRRGVWRLTEGGHRWLRDHPDATRFADDVLRSKSVDDETVTATLPATLPEDDEDLLFASQLAYEPFFRIIIAYLKEHVLAEFKACKPKIYIQRNILGFNIPDFSGCHYQIRLGRSEHEIGLHFTSSANKNTSRSRAFESQLNELNQRVGQRLEIIQWNGDLRWTRLCCVLPTAWLSEETARKYGEIFADFIEATFPLLSQIYEADADGKRTRLASAPIAARANPDLSGPFALVEREIKLIRDFLGGRTVHRPSNEQLCDWVQFCYRFEMYSEGCDLFALVNSSDVNSWYYERTKKLATICRMKAG
jgi:hypothetical protein